MTGKIASIDIIVNQSRSLYFNNSNAVMQRPLLVEGIHA